MAQFSGFWTTGGATGDQVAGYTQAHWSTAGSIFAACSGFEGVAPGWEATDEFLTTDIGGGDVSVGTGAAVVDGKWYENDAAVTVNIPTPAAGNERIDRIVARTVWANFTVRITRIVGTAAAIPVAPAITQTSGATYDIPLYQVRITDGGVITLTDERVFAGAQVDGVTLQAVGGVLGVAPEGITPVQIANRTRAFAVYPFYFFDSTDGFKSPSGFAGPGAYAHAGWEMTNGRTSTAVGGFAVPQDFVSDLTITPFFWTQTPGDLYFRNVASAYADGEALNANEATNIQAFTVGGGSINRRVDLTSLSVPAADVGDIVRVVFYRLAADPLDTIEDSPPFLGWRITYTADS